MGERRREFHVLKLKTAKNLLIVVEKTRMLGLGEERTRWHASKDAVANGGDESIASVPQGAWDDASCRRPAPRGGQEGENSDGGFAAIKRLVIHDQHKRALRRRRRPIGVLAKYS